MPSIKIIFNDGTERDFLHEGRVGGSYTKTLKFENGFVIVIDEWGHRYIFPAETIKEIKETPERRW